MRDCVNCGNVYDPNESYYNDICDECAAEQEGVASITELQ